VTALVSRSSFERIRETLALFGVRGMTVAQVQRLTDDARHVQIYRGQHFTVDGVPSIRIDLLVADGELSDVTRVISKLISQDGAVWTSPVDLVVRVRTGERGIDAL